MKRVWKYALSASHATQTLLMPRGSQPLHFGVGPDNLLFVWCLADENAEIEAAYFVVLPTGYQVPDRGAEYVGSAVYPTGAFHQTHFHLFQLTAVETKQLTLTGTTETDATT
jgi:hypothetical protein